MADDKGEKLKIGIYPNKNKASAKQPSLYFWMKKVGSDDLTEGNVGALWFKITDDCVDSWKDSMKRAFDAIIAGLNKKYIQITGNLEVQTIYEALAEAGPPGAAAVAEDDDDPPPF